MLQDVVVWALLAAGIALTLAACLGVAAVGGAWERLHFANLGTMLPPVLVAAAVLAETGLTTGGVKALLVALALVVGGPVVTHATARAVRVREHGEWRVLPHERREAREP